MGIIDSIVSRVLSKGTILHKAALSPHAYHLRIHSTAFGTADYVPGHFLRLFCGYGKDTGLGDKVRSYSVWRLDRENRIADLAVCTHSEGPGTQWIRECQPGDTIHFSWHKGKFTVDDTADSYLFVGDLSALAHLYDINRNLPEAKGRQGIIYADDEADCFADIDGRYPFRFYRLPVNPAEALLQEIKKVVPTMIGKPMVYIGGDSRICVALNAYFKKELGWETRQIKNKPFWNPEKKGLE